MRGTIDGLASPFPLADRLPAVLQEDDFLQRFLAGVDVLVAPVLATLDNLDAYVSPSLAPVDFLAWLASWVDIEPDAGWSLAQRRRIVAEAARLHRRAGTLGGIRDAVALVAGPGHEVVVEESGGCRWSSDPGGDLPGEPDAWVVATVSRSAEAGTGADDDEDLRLRTERALAAFTPAHAVWRLASGEPAS